MSLYKKMMNLGKLKGKSLTEIEAVCGKATKVIPYNFSDVGTGTRRVWKTIFCTVVLNFDKNNICCGIAGLSRPNKAKIIGTCVMLLAVIGLIVYMYASR